MKHSTSPSSSFRVFDVSKAAEAVVFQFENIVGVVA
jgi:hypothetical protein